MIPHTVSREQWCDYCKSLFNECPPINWSEIEVGDFILATRYRGFRVKSIPPKRGFILAEPVNQDGTFTEQPVRLNKADHDGKLNIATTEFLAVAFVNHKVEVQKAIGAGIDVPAWVRYEYPPFDDDTMRLFRELNEYATLNEREFGERWPIIRLNELVNKCRSQIDATKADVDELREKGTIREKEVKPHARAEVLARMIGVGSDLLTRAYRYKVILEWIESTVCPPVHA